jgi:hypothetical protein
MQLSACKLNEMAHHYSRLNGWQEITNIFLLIRYETETM